ncbi:MAG: hypothetical protein K6347_05150 [Campylobacterales bacterium]
MKKEILALLAALTMVSAASASSANSEAKPLPGEVEKKGFLMTEICFKKSTFKECDLSGWWEGKDTPILYVHDDFGYYKLELTEHVSRHELDEGMQRNGVTIIGTLVGDTIKVRAYKAPPPEGKSFFKGCL